MRRFFFVLALIFFSFSSCSKEEISEESQKPNPPSQPTIVTGVFLDSPVEGLNYRTETREGVTNSNGEFEYKEGEEVEFFVGSIKIGEAGGKKVLTPIDIAITPNATIHSLEVKNIAAFLQTLDADKNPENGIKISSKAVAALPSEQIDFRNHFIQLLGELVAEINQKALMNLKVVFPEIAAAHLAQSLKLDYEISGLEAGAFYDIIEKWETRSRNVNWIHKFDSEGRISESHAFEKFPWKPILRYTYSDYNSDGYPEFYNGHYLQPDGSSGWFVNFYLAYGPNSEVKKLSYSPSSIIDPNFYVWEIDKLDEERRVIEYSIINQGIPAGKTLIEHDDINRSIKYLTFDPGMSDPGIVDEYVFNEFGSLATSKTYTGTTLIRFESRHYRENYTLERSVFISYGDSEPEMKEIEYREENGRIYKREKYSGEFLYEIIEKPGDGSSTTKIFNKDDGSYYIEYRDTNNKKYKTEYYDADGNLLSTEE